MSKHKVLAVITARGGSKGLPGKNIRMLGDKPLLAWTIAAAQQSRLLDRTILSTDNEEIADVGRRYGVDVPFIRSAELSTDTAMHPDVMAHAVRTVNATECEPFDIVVCLQPTVPYRTPEHIDTGIQRFLESGAESLIAVKKQEYPPWLMFRPAGDKLAPAFKLDGVTNVFDMRRQEFPVIFRPSGGLYVSWIANLLKYNRLVNPLDCAFIEMAVEDSVNIDTLMDFRMAEAILANRRSEKNDRHD